MLSTHAVRCRWSDRRVPLLYTQRSVGLVTSAFLFVVALAGISVTNARGEDARPELPKDGAWVRYQMDFKYEAQDAITVIITLSFVGTVVEDGQRFRWVEVKEIERQAAERLSRVKLLVPEKDVFD